MIAIAARSPTLHVIALGANSGLNREANTRVIGRAAVELSRLLKGLRGSSVWRSPAWPPGSGPDFVNAVVAGWSPMTPARLLSRLHAIEARFGRVRHLRWGPRILDLDLVASGGLVRPDAATLRAWMALPAAEQPRRTPESLLLPHPRMEDRAFVLLPMAEIWPGWRHPLSGRSVADAAASLPSGARDGMRRLGRRPLAGPPRKGRRRK